MRAADVSQLPVLVDGSLVGIVDESDILAAVEGPEEERKAHFAGAVKDAMTSAPRTLEVHAPLSALEPIFAHNEVALVCDGGKFVGLITRIDLIKPHPLRA